MGAELFVHRTDGSVVRVDPVQHVDHRPLPFRPLRPQLGGYLRRLSVHSIIDLGLTCPEQIIPMSRRFATVSRTRVRNSSVVQMFPGAVEATLAIFIEGHLSEQSKTAPRPVRHRGTAQTRRPLTKGRRDTSFKRRSRLFVPARAAGGRAWL